MVKGAELRLASCFVSEMFYRRETYLHEWMNLSEGDFNKSGSTIIFIYEATQMITEPEVNLCER